MSSDMALLSSQSEPLDSFAVVLPDTLAFGVHHTQVVLRIRVALLSG